MVKLQISLSIKGGKKSLNRQVDFFWEFIIHWGIFYYSLGNDIRPKRFNAFYFETKITIKKYFYQLQLTAQE